MTFSEKPVVVVRGEQPRLESNAELTAMMTILSGFALNTFVRPSLEFTTCKALVVLHNANDQFLMLMYSQHIPGERVVVPRHLYPDLEVGGWVDVTRRGRTRTVIRVKRVPREAEPLHVKVVQRNGQSVPLVSAPPL